MEKEKPLLFVALDWKDKEKIWEMAEKLSEVKGNFGFKVNLDFLVKPYRTSLKPLKKAFEKPIFADMKMGNGKRTMISAIESLSKEEADFTNIYALMEQEMQRTIETVKDNGVKILGLTVLTHFDNRYCQRIFRRSLPETVRMLSEISVEAGCDGIIVPGTTLEIVEDIEILKVVSGIRPLWYRDTRHEQKITPMKAIALGADIIIVGSPITKAKDPCEKLERILSEMK